MFDIALTFLTQLCGLIPYIIGLILLFDFIGVLLFDRR